MTGFSRRPLLGAAALEGAARVRGSLYDFGEYPGIILDDGGWVSGELYRVPDLAARLPALDTVEWYDPADPEKSLYVRRETGVLLGSDARAAWIYVYNPAIGGVPERGSWIESGDWRAHLAGRRAVPR